LTATSNIEICSLYRVSCIKCWVRHTLRFAELTGVHPMVKKYPLAKANEAYARMMSGKAEFRVVLTM
jgi:D-arabinose 1-dehydrogenase-like Zn-dependent alcohol dehydrogenase